MPILDINQISLKNICSFFTSIDYNHEIIEYYKKQALLTTSLDYIWRVLTSSRFSVYSSKMDSYYSDANKTYIQNCIIRNVPIHIVLAGMPGKCANTDKVFHRTPDLGEISVFNHLNLLNSIIKIKHTPGIDVTFFSDYVGLKYSFFPDFRDIEEYLHLLKNWINDLRLPINILYVTDILPQLSSVFLDSFPHENRTYDLFKKRLERHDYTQQIIASMKDNMNLKSARSFYSSLGYLPSDEEIIKASVGNYYSFWNYWASMHAVEKYFGPVIYASPVAYHPKKRLCIRLQPSAARLAPWNGCGIIDSDSIYSIDERLCISNNYSPIIDSEGYFWGYIKQKSN